jgi:hypothetical protein
MIQLSTRIALLAFVGMLSAAPAAFAAPMNNNNTSAGQNDANGGSQAINCALPENKLNPLCTQKHIFNGTHGPNGGGNNGNNTTTTNTTGNTTTNTTGSTTTNTTGNSNTNSSNNTGGMFGNGYNGPRQGTFNFNQQDRSFFHRHFNGFSFGNFGFFGAPSFSITIGTGVPSTYHRHLRPVPSSVYRYYPWFRGYLFFVDRRGDFVIVSPRNFRIVAVL